MALKVETVVFNIIKSCSQ